MNNDIISNSLKNSGMNKIGNQNILKNSSINNKNSQMFSGRGSKENLKDISARKITNLFRKFIKIKRESRQKLFKDISSIPLSEYNPSLNNQKLDINLAPESICIYLGTKFNNQKDGLGLELFNNSKAKYFGIFNNGKRQDIGIFSINNNSQEYKYYGQIQGIYAKGYGWYIDKKALKKYEGLWDNSMKNGYGIEKYNDNSEYRGEFLNGKKHGIGYYKWSDNSLYEGEWKENKYDGFGIYKFGDGSIYEGEWKRARFHGYGEFTLPGIKKYIGFFKKDKRSGFGIQIWYQDQKTFIGFWENNNTNGYGKLIVNDKKRYGIYKEGKLIKKFNNRKEFEKKIKEEYKNYLSFFKLNDYNAVLNLIDQNNDED